MEKSRQPEAAMEHEHLIFPFRFGPNLFQFACQLFESIREDLPGEMYESFADETGRHRYNLIIDN